MARILLAELDGSLPNIALMRIAAHHRALGDEIVFRRVRHPNAVGRSMFDEPYHRIYASCIFEKTRPLAKAFKQQFPEALIGGTGWDLALSLDDVGIKTREQDYSLYPKFASSIGFLQRGCRLRCPFCVVPKKEGDAVHEQTVDDLYRGCPHPRKLVLLDNDFFGNPQWRERVDELREGKFRVAFSQGINARFLTPESAQALASLNYRENAMKKKRLYTAWDNRKDESRLFRGLGHLVEAGVRPSHIMIYMLIGYWAGETHADREYRLKKNSSVWSHSVSDALPKNARTHRLPTLGVPGVGPPRSVENLDGGRRPPRETSLAFDASAAPALVGRR